MTRLLDKAWSIGVVVLIELVIVMLLVAAARENGCDPSWFGWNC